jgi:hypothetical protein
MALLPFLLDPYHIHLFLREYQLYSPQLSSSYSLLHTHHPTVETSFPPQQHTTRDSSSMPPRPPPRGGARGSGPPPPPRGGAPPPRGGPPPQRAAATTGGPGQVVLAAHVQTIGVRKPGYGREGRPFSVLTNHFAATITDNIISHYDGLYPLTLHALIKLIQGFMYHLWNVLLR